MHVLMIRSILQHLSPNLSSPSPSPSLSPPLGFIVFLLSIFPLDSVLIFCRNILALKAIHPPLLLFHLLGQCLQ